MYPVLFISLSTFGLAIMNPLDFLDTATRLIATANPTEADIRSAISRSYYAVYHYVLSWWKSNARFPDFKDRGHAKIQIALLNAGIPTVKDFSRDVKELNENRRKADYELGMRFELENGRTILDLAHRSIVVFNALDKVALAEGVSNYLRKTNQI